MESSSLDSNHCVLATIDARERLKSLTSFIEQYRSLIDIHIVNFITHDQWQLIPETWRAALFAEDSNDDWINVIRLATGVCQASWPADLQAFVARAEELSLERTPPSLLYPSLDKRILPGMTSKKIHEVTALSKLIHDVAARKDIGSVMDLGAGQGYLSRALAFQYQLEVLAVDGSTVQTCGAKKFDTRAIKALPKRAASIRLHHVTDHVTPDNVSSLLSRWHGQCGQDDSPTSPSATNKDTVPDDNNDWLVCGLHACGDLSSLMLRLLVDSPVITSLVNVGCCYHFLSENGPHRGFPMSHFMRDEMHYQLGSTASMLACQAPSRWLDKQDETRVSFEHHFFRALLQHIMVEKKLASVESAPVIGRLNKKKDFDSFPIYTRAALERLGLPPDAILPEEAQAYYDRFKERQIDKQIAILWTIRAILAPALESIVLIDRWLFLHESLAHIESETKGVWLMPIFDPITSPRNMALVASK